MGIVSIISVVVFGISIVVQILWWVYFNKSRRVAYTFDPRNNPPR